MIINNQNVDEAISILSDYRKLHIIPLNSIYKFLKKRVEKTFPEWRKIYVSQRLKRMNAIIAKLQRNPTMNFSRMQDIWWCRAIVPTITDVYTLQNAIIKQRSRYNPPQKITDYIENPKYTWYRWIHLMYKYKATNENEKHLEWLQIEVQLRTLLQHYWSTAVETVWIFTWESLKSNQWNQDWLDFFVIASQAFAYMEWKTLIEWQPTEKEEIQKTLQNYMTVLRVNETLAWYANSLEFQENSDKNTEFSVIVLNTREKIIQQIPFVKWQFNLADDMYQMLEKKYRDDNFMQVVLLSTSVVKNLKKAYPNYFADTIEFVSNIKKFLAS